MFHALALTIPSGNSLEFPENVMSGRSAILFDACHRIPIDVGYCAVMPTFPVSCPCAVPPSSGTSAATAKLVGYPNRVICEPPPAQYELRERSVALATDLLAQRAFLLTHACQREINVLFEIDYAADITGLERSQGAAARSRPGAR